MADSVNYCSWLIPWWCFSQEVWAAWAQAILSALAIWYSGRLAYRQKQIDKREKIDTYVQLIGIATSEAALANHWIEALRHKTQPARDGAGNFGDLKADIQAISVNDLPDHRLIRVLRDAAWACEKLHSHYEVYLGAPGMPDPGDRNEVSNALDLLERCHDDAVSLREEYLTIPESAWRRCSGAARRQWHRLKRLHQRTAPR